MKIIETVILLILLMIIGLVIENIISKLKKENKDTNTENDTEKSWNNNKKFIIIYYLFTSVFIVYTIFLFLPITIFINDRYNDNKTTRVNETIVDYSNYGVENAFKIGIIFLIINIIIKLLLHKRIRKNKIFVIDIIINLIIFVILLFFRIAFSVA